MSEIEKGFDRLIMNLKTIDFMLTDLAETTEEKAWVEGYVAGKKVARKQIFFVLIFLLVCLSICFFYR